MRDLAFEGNGSADRRIQGLRSGDASTADCPALDRNAQARLMARLQPVQPTQTRKLPRCREKSASSVRVGSNQSGISVGKDQVVAHNIDHAGLLEQLSLRI